MELALTRLAPWNEQTPQLLKLHKSIFDDLGLVVPSLQAILFEVDGVSLLGDHHSFKRFLNHLDIVASRGVVFGARVAVLGAPRQRSRGHLSRETAFDLGIKRLSRAASLMDSHGMVLGLEPVPSSYGGDFLTTADEVLKMVKMVDHPGLRIHLDTGCALLGGRDIGDEIRTGATALVHFHVAEPDLGNFVAPRSDHASAAAALRAIDYNGWLSIEMRQSPRDYQTAALQAFAFVQQTYRGISSVGSSLE